MQEEWERKDKIFIMTYLLEWDTKKHVKKIQELYLAGNKKDAIAAVPTEMVEAISLIGPPAKIKDELSLWEESVVNTMLISGGIDLVRFVYDLVS